MTLPEWTRLENSAIIYPSCKTHKYAAVYRMSVTLDSKIDSEILDTALLNTMPRFPSFRYTIKKGFFWWFLQRLENDPQLSSSTSLNAFNLRKNGGYMFKLSCTGARIDLDVFHALTDGTGAMTFLLSVAAEYLKLSAGVDIQYGKWVFDPSEEPAEEEMEDGFDQFSGTKGALDSEEKAYHIKGTVERHDILNSLGVSIKLQDIASVAKTFDCTITELVSALMLYSLQEVRSSDNSVRKSSHLRMELPVNLRPIFESKTLRNFSSYVYIGLDVTNGDYKLKDAIQEVKYQKRLYTQRSHLTKRIAANVALEDNMAIRCVPLFIKKPIINIINHLKGDKYATYTFSNMGNIELPEGMKEHVKDIHFILGRTRKRSGSCACVTYGDTLNLDFSRKIAEDDFERAFLKNLRSLGIWARVQVPSPSLRPERGRHDRMRPVFKSSSLIPKFLLCI
ncbi:MAG: hypothetical protein J6O51_01175 [Bacteroidales bacterium]|nr:hypothetical protein [Bacteroidales bacterium]